MAKKLTAPRLPTTKETDLSPLVAASLAATIYQARLFNRQARMNVPEASVITEVVSLWRSVLADLERRPK